MVWRYRGLNAHRTSVAIDTLFAGSALQGRSSLDLGWETLVVERRAAASLERAEQVLDHHYLVLCEGSKPAAAQVDYPKGKSAPVKIFPGTLALGVAGVVPAFSMRVPYKGLVCLLNPRVVAEIESELEMRLIGERHERFGLDEAALAQLMRLAAKEVDELGASGRLYADALAHAIIIRFIRAAQPSAQAGESQLHPLPRHRLRVILDRINSEFDQDLDLSTLARDSGYSRAHFLRMFRAAMGKTPHHYLTDVRLERARQYLERNELSIAEVALKVGFSSHSHLTKVFHQRFGMTPSAYRRSKTG
jgi:AraC family transcriptional regulator